MFKSIYQVKEVELVLLWRRHADQYPGTGPICLVVKSRLLLLIRTCRTEKPWLFVHVGLKNRGCQLHVFSSIESLSRWQVVANFQPHGMGIQGIIDGSLEAASSWRRWSLPSGRSDASYQCIQLLSRSLTNRSKAKQKKGKSIDVDRLQHMHLTGQAVEVLLQNYYRTYYCCYFF